MAVCMDHDEEMSGEKLQSSILNHMEANVDYYQKLHTGNVLKDVKRYFKLGTYCDSIVDIVVIAVARALNINLKIYQRGTSGNIQIQEHITNTTGKEIHLKFTHDNSNVAMNHYDCILLLEEPIPCHSDEQVTIESPPPTTMGQATCMDDADVVDLMEDCDSTTSEH